MRRTFARPVLALATLLWAAAPVAAEPGLRHGTLSAASDQPPAAIARAMLGDGELGEAMVRPIGEGHVVVVPQRFDGLAVVGGGVALRLDAAGRVRWIDDRRRALPPLPGARLTRADATARAEAITAAQAHAATLVVYAPPLVAPRRAWRIDLAASPRADSLSAPRLYLAADDGALLAREDRAAAAAPLAEVWPVSPVETPRRQRVALALPSGAPALIAAGFAIEGCRDLGTCLETQPGLRQHACRRDHYAAPDPAGDFLALPPADHGDPDDDFAEVQAFHHVSTALARLEALAGGAVAPTLRVVVNYRPAEAFSVKDCGDGVYDGDVVAHELGHAVLFSLTPELSRGFVDRAGWNPTPAALHEGLADLLAVAVTDDPEIGEYVGTGVGDGEPVRDLRVFARCPDDLRSAKHGDALPFSGAVWAARATLPAARRVALDQALLAAIAGSDAFADFDAMARLMLAEAEELAGAEVAAALEIAFAGHGILGCDGRVRDAGAGVGRAVVPAGVPAPFQLRLELDRPAAAIALDLGLYDSYSSAPRDLIALVKVGDPIVWRSGPGGLNHDAGFASPVEAIDPGGDRRGHAVIAGPFAPGVHHLTLYNRGDEVFVERVTARPDGELAGCAAGGGGGLGPALLVALALGLALGLLRSRRVR